MICVFPYCQEPVVGTNRAGQPACLGHVPVVVSGSYVEKDAS